MKFAAVLLILLISFKFVPSQQNSFGQCKVVGKVVCDENPSNPAGPSPLSRGKRGPRGEKGDVGSPGRKGESNKHVISKHAKKIELFETKFQQQSELIEKQSEIIKNNSIFIQNQSEIIEKNSVLIDELSRCEIAPLENAEVLRHNDSSAILLRHNQAVEYQCKAGYIPQGLSVRKCVRGKIQPPILQQPFVCNEVCSLIPCKNNGTCNRNLNNERFYNCSCLEPYFGYNCEKKYCKDVNPCSNGGVCNSTTGGTGYKCSCLPKYYGDLCQYEYCKDSNPCLNDGICTTTDKEYKCDCKYGCGGINCEIDVCYRFQITSYWRNYHDSKSYCNNRGGEIVSRLLGSDGLNYHSEIWRVINSQDHSDIWVGLTDYDSEGTWTYTSGERATNLMFSWVSGQPDNWNGNEDCVIFSKSLSGLIDIGCHINRRIVCQFPNGRC